MFRLVLIPDSGSISVDVLNFMRKRFNCNDIGIYLKFKKGKETNYPELGGLLIEVDYKQIKDYVEVPGNFMDTLCESLSKYDLPIKLIKSIYFTNNLGDNNCEYYYGFFPLHEDTLNNFKKLVYTHS